MGVRHLIAACAAAMACACAASADASIVYASVPDLTAKPTGDWIATAPVMVAGLFSLSASETVVRVDFTVDPSTDPSYISLGLLTDNAGQLGKTLLGAGIGGSSITVTPTAQGTDLFSVALPGAFTMAAGSYWLVIAGHDTMVDSFSGSGAMLQCTNDFSDCTSTGQTLGFDLQGYAAGGAPPGLAGLPEPATWAMLLLGVAGLGAALRRRQAFVVPA